MFTPFGLSALALGIVGLAAAILLAVAGANLAPFAVGHDHRLSPIVIRRTRAHGMAPGWLLHRVWWTVPVGLAVARMLGPGVPTWLAAAIALGTGILDALCRGRLILVVAIPGAVALSLLLVNGTGCTTGLGLGGYLVLPVVAFTVHRAVAVPLRSADPDRSRWRPETIAAVSLLIVEWIVLPMQVTFDLLAEPPAIWWMAGVIAVTVVVAWWAAQRGQAVAGLAIGSVLGQAGLLAGPTVCLASPASALVAVAGVAIGSSAITAVLERRPSTA